MSIKYIQRMNWTDDSKKREHVRITCHIHHLSQVWHCQICGHNCCCSSPDTHNQKQAWLSHMHVCTVIPTYWGSVVELPTLHHTPCSVLAHSKVHLPSRIKNIILPIQIHLHGIVYLTVAFQSSFAWISSGHCTILYTITELSLLLTEVQEIKFSYNRNYLRLCYQYSL